jgi:CHASE2 domain-containing sensor protein
MGAVVKDRTLQRMDKIRIGAAVAAVVVVIAAIGYFMFDMPGWVAIAGALAAILVNGLLTLFGRKRP